ncbi:MAG: hypothetical protein AB7D29_01635 [Campylobacterales bacterium]
MISRVLVGARTDESEKVGFSMQMPKELKEKFDAYCKKNKVTMTAMLQSFMQYIVNVDEGIEVDRSEIPSFHKATIVSLLRNSISSATDTLEEMERNGADGSDAFMSLIGKRQDYVYALDFILGDKK